MQFGRFHHIRPSFETTQEETLEWLVQAHTKAENGAKHFQEEIQEKFSRVGCKPHHIAKRGHVLNDFKHLDWEQMEVYRLHEERSGKNLSQRTKVFEKNVDDIFEQYYPEGSTPPDDLIHVSCTGYISPSGAQSIVSKRNWGATTTVTHAYHMGCYGSLPALRMGRGFLQTNKRVDIVHTEICCLHTNPSLHALDQLVSQSLFADGFIKYSIENSFEEDHFKVINIREEIIPNSLKAMSWNVADWGFQMSLAKEVPVHITRHLPQYLERLCLGKIQDAIFAVHPGGPKILHYVQERLQLSDIQMKHSFGVLHDFGNMSSATLPHIWERILRDEEIPNQTPIISLAFGPGLTIAGSSMVKVCGS